MTWTPNQIDAALDLLRSLDKGLAELREDFARREERRLKEARAIPQSSRSASSSNGGGACFPNYGRRKGEPVAGAEIGDLEYYRTGCIRTLGDSGKSRWHSKEQALLDAINTEIERREGTPAPDRGAAGTDDDIPF